MTATTHDQFEILMDFMEKNEGIAKNFLNTLQYRDTLNFLWNEVKDRLNAVGPPEKSVEGWKKVWRDFKYNTKSKLRHNKKVISGTGGGPCRIKRLNNLEERLNVLMDLQGEIEGINAKSFGCLSINSENPINTIATSTSQMDNIASTTNSHNASTNLDQQNEGAPVINEAEPPIIDETEPTAVPIETSDRNRPTRAKKQPKETSKSLLKKQIQIQESFYKKQDVFLEKQHHQRKEMTKALKEIRNLFEKKLSLEGKKLSLAEKKLSFEEGKWKAKQKIIIDQMKQKADIIEIKQKELELKQLEFEARH